MLDNEPLNLEFGLIYRAMITGLSLYNPAVVNKNCTVCSLCFYFILAIPKRECTNHLILFATTFLVGTHAEWTAIHSLTRVHSVQVSLNVDPHPFRHNGHSEWLLYAFTSNWTEREVFEPC